MAGRGDPLTDADRAAVDALSRSLDEAADLDQLGARTVEGLARLLDAVSISYNELNPGAARAYARIHPEPDAGWWRRYRPIFERHMADNPLLPALANGVATALTWEDVDPAGTFRRTPLFREFYAPLGIESQLAIALEAPHQLVIGVAVNRGPEGFEPRDRAVLEALRPALARAHRRIELAADRRAMADLLAQAGWLVVLVDGDGTVVDAPPEADRIAFGTGAALPPELRTALEVATRPPDGTPPASSPPVRVSVPGHELAAVVSPSRVPPHLVMVRHRPSADAEALRSLGLTPRQAEVAALLADGRSNEAIGRALGISPRTVKKHLEAVYGALGVGRRAEAVAALGTHVGRLDPFTS